MGILKWRPLTRFFATGIFRFCVDFRAEISGVGRGGQNAAAEADFRKIKSQAEHKIEKADICAKFSDFCKVGNVRALLVVSHR